jgi:ParB family transcriptional regulator, chromosome partitioning protein
MSKSPEKRGLGRGLSALMADVKAAAPDQEAFQRGETLVPVENLEPNPQQPRIDFGSEELRSLADSIRQKGVIQPLIVRRKAGENRFEIVAGERRWRAAQLAQVHEIPVIIREFSDSEVLEVAIIENVQREDLNAIEEALGLRQLMTRFGHTHEKLAEALSKSRSHVANLLRLLSLPDEVQSMVRAGTLSAGHARALISSSNALELAQRVVGKGLSVRETERMVREDGLRAVSSAAKARHKTNTKDADTLAIEADLSANLRMSVRIDHEAGGDGGTLTIRYYSLDDLDMLCRVLSVIPRDVGKGEF